MLPQMKLLIAIGHQPPHIDEECVDRKAPLREVIGSLSLIDIYNQIEIENQNSLSSQRYF